MNTILTAPEKSERTPAELALIGHFQVQMSVVDEVKHNLSMFSTPTKGYILTGNIDDLKVKLTGVVRTLAAIHQQLCEKGTCVIQPKEA